LYCQPLFFDYEHEDEEEDEKQSAMVSIHWWAIPTV